MILLYKWELEVHRNSVIKLMFIKCTLKGYLHAFHLLLFDNTLPQSQKRLCYMHSSETITENEDRLAPHPLNLNKMWKSHWFEKNWKAECHVLWVLNQRCFIKILWDFKSGNSSWNLIYTVSIKKESQSSNSGPLPPTEQWPAAVEGFRTQWAIFHSFHFCCWSCTCMP